MKHVEPLIGPGTLEVLRSEGQQGEQYDVVVVAVGVALAPGFVVALTLQERLPSSDSINVRVPVAKRWVAEVTGGLTPKQGCLLASAKRGVGRPSRRRAARRCLQCLGPRGSDGVGVRGDGDGGRVIGGRCQGAILRALSDRGRGQRRDACHCCLADGDV